MSGRHDAFVAAHELTECDDPAAVLRRLAAYHGAVACEAFAGRYPERVDVSAFDALPRNLRREHLYVLPAHVAAVRARLAWRYALAVIRLDEAAQMADLLRAFKCSDYRPDANGECVLCDEPASEHPAPDYWDVCAWSIPPTRMPLASKRFGAAELREATTYSDKLRELFAHRHVTVAITPGMFHR